MAKRYYYDKRPEGRSKEEQAKINKQNWDEFYQGLLKSLQGAVDWMHQKEEDGLRLRRAFDSGEVAFTCEELSTLEFNDDYTVAKYDDKEVKFKKGGLESEMLGILCRAVKNANKTIVEEQLVGSLERATGKDCDFKTVRNTRDRLNAKFQDGLGLPNVVKLDDGKYGLEERFLRAHKK